MSSSDSTTRRKCVVNSLTRIIGEVKKENCIKVGAGLACPKHRAKMAKGGMTPPLNKQKHSDELDAGEVFAAVSIDAYRIPRIDKERHLNDRARFKRRGLAAAGC